MNRWLSWVVREVNEPGARFWSSKHRDEFSRGAVNDLIPVLKGGFGLTEPSGCSLSQATIWAFLEGRQRVIDPRSDGGPVEEVVRLDGSTERPDDVLQVDRGPYETSQLDQDLVGRVPFRHSRLVDGVRREDLFQL